LERRPALGYAMVALAAVLFGVNGAVSKVILQKGPGLSPARLTEVRCTGALVGLAALLLVVGRPRAFAVTRRELGRLAVLGIAGLALVQWAYFFAIHRIGIGIALLIQYLAPILVALFARFVLHEAVRRRIWLALALSVSGLALIVEIWHGGRLSTAGIAAAGLAAFTYAIYVLLAEREVRTRDPLSAACYAFLFAALFWSVLEPWWSFPAGRVGDSVSLLGNLAGTHVPLWALIAWMVVLGTIVPFGLIFGALQHASATRVAIVAMLEPVVAILVAYAWLGESLDPVQLGGAALVLGAIVLAQTAR
jgi:drug/metabolite transporter (DMT)-like permease